MNRSDAVKAFLNQFTHPDLASLYYKGMEVQVNVAKDEGERIEAGEFRGRAYVEWTDGIERWKSFRIPMKAMSTPEDNDGPIKFNLIKRCEGIGMTGWDWQLKKSIYVAYDFDAMVGHSDLHTKKLSDKELGDIQEAVKKLPFITIRRSTSGKGLHLYVFIEPIETQNHTEHAALARAILSMISGRIGFNLAEKVDIAGQNMWVWHRKMKGTDGLKLIKQGDKLAADLIPINWKDHLDVVSKRSSRINYSNLNGTDGDLFDQLCQQRSKVKLDEEHLKLINWLSDRKLAGWWNPDAHMLVTHTVYLKEAHAALGFKGEFHTLSSGRDYGHDLNSFCYPLRNGAWIVRRFGAESSEHKIWSKDTKGFVKCYFNRGLTLEEVARLYDAIELENKGYQFINCVSGAEAMAKLAVKLELPPWINSRIMKVKENGTDRYVIMIPKEDSDNAGEMKDWAIERGSYKRMWPNPKRNIEDEANSTSEFDDAIRHIVSEHGEDLGWLINDGQGEWREEPINHIRLLLKSKGMGGKDIDLILGNSISRAWTVVNKPFQPEYPGDRQWNRSKARFKIPPTLEGENLTYPTWDRILKHCGQNLDEPISKNVWCKEYGISSGADYLKLFFACLIKFPQNPLPYLAFYGPQDSGKSSIHEAFCEFILDGGYVRADNALANPSGFNGELEGAVLAIIEETNVAESGKNKTAEQRLKDWVTSNRLSIHAKGKTPRMCPNYTHWIQCTNEASHIPIFSGDTRVTLMYVPEITEKIPKRDLWVLLKKEAPDFLAALMLMDVPDSRDRLMIPVINTIDKEEAEYRNMTVVEKFFKDHIHYIPGAYVSSEELFKAFCKENPTEATSWSRNKFGREVPRNIVRGRISKTGTQNTYYGNISLSPDVQPSAKWVNKGNLFISQES